MVKNKLHNGSNWKRILNEIYTHSPHSWCESSKCGRDDDNHPIAKKLKINGQELRLGVSFLVNHKLIEVKEHTLNEFWAEWELTPKGFDVALNNQKQENSERLQEVIAIGAFLMALITLLNFLKPEKQLDVSLIIIIFLVLIIILLSITMVIIIWPIILPNHR